MIDWLLRLLGRDKPRISAAAPRDAAAISILHERAFRRGWSEEEVHALLSDDAVIAHALSVKRRLAGFVLARMAADEAEILSIAISERQRGRGFGHSLLDQHLGWLAGRGVRAVFLEVEEGNRAALALYRRAGFRQVGRRPNYYPQPGGRPAAALVLRRDLV